MRTLLIRVAVIGIAAMAIYGLYELFRNAVSPIAAGSNARASDLSGQSAALSIRSRPRLCIRNLEMRL